MISKISENAENEENEIFFKKIINSFSHKQTFKCLVFFKLAGRVHNQLYFNSIKTALKTLIFFK